jgi:hypothetical protein
VIWQLKAVLFRDTRAVAQPFAYNVNRKTIGKLRLSACPQVLKRLRPERQAGTPNDSVRLRSKVLPRVSVSTNDVDGPLRCRLEGLRKVWAQLGKDR